MWKNTHCVVSRAPVRPHAADKASQPAAPGEPAAPAAPGEPAAPAAPGEPAAPAASKKPVDSKKEEIEKEALDLETIIATQDANGMFKAIAERKPPIVDPPSAKTCYEHIRDARRKLAEDPFTMTSFAEAKYHLSIGWNSLEKGIDAAGRGYKLKKVYAVPHIILMVVIVGGLLFVGFNYPEVTFLTIIPLPIMIAGALGAVLINLFWLTYEITSRKYVEHWFTYTMYVPILGALLGTFAFLIVTGSVGVIPAASDTFKQPELSDSTNNSTSSTGTGSVGVALTSSEGKNPSGLLFISFLAGIGWKKSIAAFDRVFDAFFGAKKESGGA